MALAWAALLHAEGRPPARKEIRARFLLLRLKFPKLKAVRFGGLAGKIAAWLPVGQAIPVWVTDSRRKCAEDSLLRRPDRHGMPSFVVRGCTPKARDEQGRWQRTCVDEPVGRDWWTSDGVVTEVRAGATWRKLSGMGMGDPVQGNGILSEVTVDTARFRGRLARLSTACEDRAVPCSAGARIPAWCACPLWKGWMRVPGAPEPVTSPHPTGIPATIRAHPPWIPMRRNGSNV
jgi:hypothetical protein